MVNFAVGGYFGDKTLEEMVTIYEMRSSNSQQKASRGKRVSVHELSTNKNMGAQLAELTRQMQ